MTSSVLGKQLQWWLSTGGPSSFQITGPRKTQLLPMVTLGHYASTVRGDTSLPPCLLRTTSTSRFTSLHLSMMQRSQALTRPEMAFPVLAGHISFWRNCLNPQTLLSTAAMFQALVPLPVSQLWGLSRTNLKSVQSLRRPDAPVRVSDFPEKTISEKDHQQGELKLKGTKC